MNSAAGQPARRTVAAMGHQARSVPGQLEVADTINEDTASAPLFETLASTSQRRDREHAPGNRT